ncbi:MAG: DUF2330 domain-containing protein [bacterium]
MRSLTPSLLAGAALLAAPAAALACGGFFCDNAQPINQSAERILFAADGATMHMHVQVAYQGPPQDFGWLLPAAPGVEVALSSEQLFTSLDQLYGPRFIVRQLFDPGCEPPPVDFDGGPFPAPEAGGEGGVDVLSRQPVGPYDSAVLQADDVMVLRAWLDENGFQIPPAIDAKLQPYIDRGQVFVAIKLLPGADAGDITPLHLSFPASRPAVPIVPTGVAAEADMGVIVHVLGGARAVPLNYRHVEINEAALDLAAGGSNYVDVVAAAVDEAGGLAFATDFAGAIDDRLATALRPIDLAAAAALATVRDLVSGAIPLDADIQRVAAGQLVLPEGITPADFWQCPFCYDDVLDQPLDAAALAAEIEAEVNPAREHLGALLARHGYLTRLFTTLNPDEMTLDPEFGQNPDLPEQPATRTIEVRVPCDGGQPDRDGAELVNAAGETVPADLSGQSAVRRAGGETVNGADRPAAAVIARLTEAGPPEIIGGNGEDPPPMPGADGGVDVPGGGGSPGGTDGGCACDAGTGAPAAPTLAALALLALAGVRRRWR